MFPITQGVLASFVLSPPAMTLVISPTPSTTWALTVLCSSINNPETARVATRSGRASETKPVHFPLNPISPVTHVSGNWIGIFVTPATRTFRSHICKQLSTEAISELTTSEFRDNPLISATDSDIIGKKKRVKFPGTPTLYWKHSAASILWFFYGGSECDYPPTKALFYNDIMYSTSSSICSSVKPPTSPIVSPCKPILNTSRISTKRPSCKYGAVRQTSCNVGVSKKDVMS